MSVETVTVEHNGSQVETPLTFERSDLATWFGAVPETFDVERVFIYEGTVRAEAYLGEETWVEVVHQTEESAPVDFASELGWVANTLSAPGPGATEDPGETVWRK